MKRSLLSMIAALLVACSSSPPAQQQSGLVTGPYDYEPTKYVAAESAENAPGPCSQCKKVILIHLDGEQFGPVDDAFVADLASQLRTRYGLDVVVGEPQTAPRSTFDAGRNQYNGNALIEHFEANGVFPSEPDGAARIMLMDEDLYLSSRPDWGWAFGYRVTFKAGGGHAVLSSARMYGELAARRMSVMLGKYMGGLACGFAYNNDPQSVMYNKIEGVPDLDRMRAVACHRSTQRR